ncbi:MAG: hypothetical protein QUV05_23585 [Phycisphaerae bacterium]|nr:hypothetical protein [Phycisphaerae bacterium]
MHGAIDKMYSRRYVILVLLLLGSATVVAHSKAIWDGWFLDDHWHRRQYMDDQWSLQSLLDATTIKPDVFMEAWWQTENIQWQYIRPISILIAKALYHLSDGSVKALHLLSILLHLANAVMVHHLCIRLTRRRFWSMIGALLFVVYSHGLYAVAWLAAQNTVLMTTLTLGALLCYVRASGLNLYAAPMAEPKSLNGGWRAAEGRGSNGGVASLRWSCFAGAMFLWLLALGSRENAIVFPVLAASFDLAFEGWRHLRARLPGLLLMIAAASAFAVWRLLLNYEPVPDFYLRRPDGPGYVLWWLAKLLHYVTATIWLSPMTVGPTGRFDPVAEVPGDCLLMLLIVGVMATGYYQACRRARGWWIWPLWIVLALLPVTPIMATPHSGYMPGVAFAVGMVLGAALRDRLAPTGIGRWCRPAAIWFLVATTTYMPIYRTMWRSVLAAERWTIDEITTSARPDEATDIFLINVPFVNIYAKYHMQEAWAGDSDAWLPATAPNLCCHVLTYADNVLRMQEPCRLNQIDAYTFSLSCGGRGYFSGALGRFCIEGMRAGRRLEPEQVIRKEGTPFEVQIVRADWEGVKELKFRFHKPLATSRYLFYLTSAGHPAARLGFWGPQGPPQVPGLRPVQVDDASVSRYADVLGAGQAGAAEGLFSAMNGADSPLAQKAWVAFREVACPISRSLAAPVQDDLAGDLPSEPVRTRVREWWIRSVDDRTMAQLWLDQGRRRRSERERDALFRIREVAARVIRTDLYLTGPPYPGPK